MTVAVVTGAGSGVGRASARALLAAGFRVALAGRREDALRETAEGFPDTTLVVPTDVAREDSVVALFDAVVARWDRVDVLFNNAGTNVRPTPVEEFGLGAWEKVVGVNLTGAFLCAREAFRVMKAHGGGRIINNGSVSASVPRPHAVAYNATKHAMTGLTKALSLEGRAHNIACGQIDIGNAATALTEQMGRGVLQADLELAAEPTFDVRHVADAVLYQARLPLEANVQFMTVMATTMPYIGRG
ncbi:NADP-dependent 3-hydroxy acid dehydrogenase YdfG [Lentzea xinjiangensis]|uniref:NADP-dependent 3-hydroxy acid dehydrogenase YdfG n=1 Tax=Lentzea xinjiangensis TaxID=402600 RepID=A0A1H9L420_9PSEU|nr:SDR family oxidoreductase [Lentzea xinjiangensis]SER06120.1 NADP-dependent 3-hydroxy acid dehydrogenase YdfG [Lentzea xinjiangensis]